MVKRRRLIGKRAVLKKLRKGGFDLNAIVFQGRQELQVGFFDDKTVRYRWATLFQLQANVQLAKKASAILGWDYFIVSNGSCWLQAEIDPWAASRYLVYHADGREPTRASPCYW